MKVCPQCGRTFPDAQLYCSYDGSTLIVENGSSSSAQAAQQPMYYQPIAAAVPSQKYMSSKAKTWLIILSIISMVLSLGIIIVYFFVGWRAALNQSIGLLSATVMLILYIFSDRIPNWIFAMLMGLSVLWSIGQVILTGRASGLSLSTSSFFISNVLTWIINITLFVFFLLACLNKITKTPALILIGILLLFQLGIAAFSLYTASRVYNGMTIGKIFLAAYVLIFLLSLCSHVIRFIYTAGMYKAREENALPSYYQTYPNPYPYPYQ